MKPKREQSGPSLWLAIAIVFILYQCQKPAKTAKDVDWNLVDQLIEHRY